MKKVLPYLILIIVIALGAYGGYYYSSKSPIIGIKTVKSSSFAWGVTMRPHALAKYTAKSWAAQTALVKELGANYARIDWQYDAKPTPEKFADSLIDENELKGLETYMIIQSKDPMSTLKDPYQSGYDIAYSIASKFKGRIKYYQLINEGSAEILVNHTANGQEVGHYNAKQYVSLIAYLKGLSAGISAGDPNAKKVVTMAYTHYIYLDWLQRDNLDYDTIGVDWYDWMGKFEEKKLENGQTLYDRLKSYKKEIIFAEINSLPEPDLLNKKNLTTVNQERQAKFITEEATWAWQNKDFIKGFFVLELLDNVNATDIQYFGLVTAEKNSEGVFEIGVKRKAFDAYEAVIKKSF